MSAELVPAVLPQQRHILLTGEPGSGKTTLLLDLLFRSVLHRAGGMVTEEIRCEEKREGFRLRVLGGMGGIFAHVGYKSYPQVDKYGVDVRIMEHLGIPAIISAIARKSFVVIDEIAQMQLLCPTFEPIVTAAFDSSRLVIATVQLRPHPFTDALKARSDVSLFHLTCQNREDVRNRALARLGRFLS